MLGLEFSYCMLVCQSKKGTRHRYNQRFPVPFFHFITPEQASVCGISGDELLRLRIRLLAGKGFGQSQYIDES